MNYSYLSSLTKMREDGLGELDPDTKILNLPNLLSDQRQQLNAKEKGCRRPRQVR